MFKTTITSLILLAVVALGVIACLPGNASAADFGNGPVAPCPVSDPSC